MAIRIKENIWWTGKIDWSLRKFHGDHLSTNRGSSFNSYIIKDEKTVLIDSVWKPHTSDFLKSTSEVTDINDIDYVICNHGEPDHSGALPHLISMIPDVPVYCTKNGMKTLKGHYHKDWNFVIVKSGDKLNIGSKELIFIEAAMLHWPDTMMTYLTGDNILFSNDVFGQHLASEFMLSSKTDKYELNFEAKKYFANIISPFSSKAKNKLDELESMNLPIDMICPAHGVIWDDDIDRIIADYKNWSEDYKEDKITLIYETMYDSTRKMAEEIIKGIKAESPDTEVKLFNASNADRSDLITEVFASKGVLLGSSTINNGILPHLASILEEIKGLAPKNKKAACFGSYGWSPSAIKIMNEGLSSAGFELLGNGIKAQWNPDNASLKECYEFGKTFASSFK